MTDFAEKLREHWWTARLRAEQLGMSSAALNEARGVLRSLERLAKDCDIELEPEKCVLCGEPGAKKNWFNAPLCCVDADGCQRRQLVRYEEQLKAGAR